MVTVVWQIKNSGVHFIANRSIDLDKIQTDAKTCWFVEANAKSILHEYYSRKRIMKYMLNIVMCQDTCELICFKLGMMLNTAELYSLNDLDIRFRSQGYRKPRTCAVIVL